MTQVLVGTPDPGDPEETENTTPWVTFASTTASNVSITISNAAGVTYPNRSISE